MKSSLRLARTQPSYSSVAMTKRRGWPSLHERPPGASERWDGSRAEFLAGLDPGSQHDWLRAAVGEPS